MITNDVFKNILGIKENFEMPEKLMKVLIDPEQREGLITALMEHVEDMETDFLNEIFQNEHGDRDSLKQDFTPDCLCELVANISGPKKTCADICSGSGSLTIKKWAHNKNTYFYCEEVSSRTIPILLLNLCIRNISGKVIHGNSISMEINAIYRLDSGIKYSDISCEIPISSTEQFDTVIMNPPYSLKFDNIDIYKNDWRFKGFGIPPKKAMDYAFLLHGLSKLKDDGELFAIVPHGVLFRGGKEEEIRKNLIRENLIHAVIGLPDKLFLHTSIPVCIMVLKRNRKEKKILFIDASNEFEKCGKQNKLRKSDIDKISYTFLNYIDINKYSHVASAREIEENQYNLNIPRYVDNFEPEPVPDIIETLNNIRNIEGEIKKCENDILEMMKELCGITCEKDEEIKRATNIFEENIKSKYQKK